MTKKSIQDHAFFGNTKKVKTCIERGDDLNTLDEEGSTALHWAVEEGMTKSSYCCLIMGRTSTNTIKMV